jgi:hypothetical protein
MNGFGMVRALEENWIWSRNFMRLGSRGVHRKQWIEPLGGEGLRLSSFFTTIGPKVAPPMLWTLHQDGDILKSSGFFSFIAQKVARIWQQHRLHVMRIWMSFDSFGSIDLTLESIWARLSVSLPVDAI